MIKIALSAIVALVFSVGVFQVALLLTGSTEEAARTAIFITAIAAFIAVALAPDDAFAFIAATFAIAFAAAAFTGVVATAALVLVAAFFIVAVAVAAAFAVAIAAKQKSVRVEWAMAIYGILALMAFSAFNAPSPAISLTIAAAGTMTILVIWRLYAMRQAKAIAA